jgi:hypothetical protein
MLLNERWIWIGEPLPFAESGITIFRLYPGSWMLAYGSEALGPFDDRTILRATRIACTPCIDGCELGPPQAGVRALSCARRPLRREARWREILLGELPVSVTVYDSVALEPVRGCCTTFAAMPKVGTNADDTWQAHMGSTTARGHHLLATWNAHPAGSVIVAEGDLEAGFAVVDLP